MIRFGSVCSGIEAASIAFAPLGWKAAWLAEIEPFPSAVLAHHYPDVPNLGDMTKIAARVRSGGITLNHDGGRWLSLSLPGDLPAVVREVNGQWQRQ